MTKELRAHEKDINLPDKDALATEFVHAFNIKKEAGKPLTKEEKELLCSIFQVRLLHCNCYNLILIILKSTKQNREERSKGHCIIVGHEIKIGKQ